MNDLLIASFNDELINILDYWRNHTIDAVHGGFAGRLNEHGEVVEGAMKGSVLNARILWACSAAYEYRGDEAYLAMAKRAYEYITSYFTDHEYGGIYWSVTADGQPLDTKKQIYAIAFTIYGLAAYYAACGEEKALEAAKRLYTDIERHSYDPVGGGYLEALTRVWLPIGDLRLSEKDANEKKTMNTHLHILEAYTTLYRVWPDGELGKRIRELTGLFMDRIVDVESGHLGLFFDDDWAIRYSIVSYGHDIEAAWLLTEAAEVLSDPKLLSEVRRLAVRIAIASEEGVNADGSMSYEFDGRTGHLDTDRHWWVQAEAVVGFLNAWEITGEQRWMERAAAAWEYTRKQVIDHAGGEWFWGIQEDGTVMPGQDKAGFWKCPYHNSRACLEAIKRLSK